MSRFFDTPEAFRDKVDMVAAMFRLDPDLPELIDLRHRAAELIESEEFFLLSLLRELQPDRDVLRNRKDGSVIVLERPYRRTVLHAWTVARIAVLELDERIVKIVANDAGTCLFDSYCNVLVRFQAAAIEPYRFASDGSRERNAAEIIRVFTGHQIDWGSASRPDSVLTAITVSRPDQYRLAWDEPLFSYTETRPAQDSQPRS